MPVNEKRSAQTLQGRGQVSGGVRFGARLAACGNASGRLHGYSTVFTAQRAQSKWWPCHARNKWTPKKHHERGSRPPRKTAVPLLSRWEKNEKEADCASSAEIRAASHTKFHKTLYSRLCTVHRANELKQSGAPLRSQTPIQKVDLNPG